MSKAARKKQKRKRCCRGGLISLLDRTERTNIMLIKTKKYLWNKNYYKVVIILISMSAIFEFVFQYRFQSKIDIVYFFIASYISVIMIKDIVGSKTKKYLPVFYYFWPFIIIFINWMSHCKFALLPFVVSSYIIVICGKYKKKFLKVLILVSSLTIATMYLLLIAGYFIVNPQIEIKDTVYSPDNKYVMVVEETNFFLGGQVYVYFGRNIEFGVLGYYMPYKVKYYGNTDVWPELEFIDDDFISINGQLIETKGNNYIDEKGSDYIDN